MANKYFKGNFEECAMEKGPTYLYIDNVKDFLNDCGDDWITDGVDEPGIYQWKDDYEVWTMANSNIEKKIKTIVEQSIPHQGGEIFVGWNILVTLDTDETIKINSEPISINDIHEAINTLLKPSFFGKRIKKFEIVAE
jgi:hypothetical protein